MTETTTPASVFEQMVETLHREEAMTWTQARRVVNHLSPLVVAFAQPPKEPPAPEVLVMQVETPDGEEELAVDVTVPTYVRGVGVDQVAAVAYYRDGEFVVACPHDGCSSTDFYEVDRSERWNPMELADAPQPETAPTTYTVKGGIAVWEYGPNPLAGLPLLVTSQGSDGDGFQTEGHLCQSCNGWVSLPDWLASEWVS